MGDLEVFDHIIGNKSLFIHFYTNKSLLTITLVNRSKINVQVIGKTNPLLSLPLELVLYISDYLLNLISISQLTHTFNCSITFSTKSYFIQDRSIRMTISTEYESQKLYYI